MPDLNPVGVYATAALFATAAHPPADGAASKAPMGDVAKLGGFYDPESGADARILEWPCLTAVTGSIDAGPEAGSSKSAYATLWGSAGVSTDTGLAPTLGFVAVGVFYLAHML